MKKTNSAALLLTLTMALLISCGPTEDVPRQFAEKFMAAETKAWTTGDLADLKGLESNDVVYHLPGLDITGWKAHEDYIVHGRATVSNFKPTWKYLSGEGDHLILAYNASANVKTDETSEPVPTSISYLFAIRLKDRKIAEVWSNGSITSTPSADPQK